jgi:hypothetical protein
MFSIGAFLRGTPWFLEIRNFDPGSGEILDHFDTAGKQIAETGVASWWGGGLDAPTPDDRKRLVKAATKKPRNPKEFRRLLAAVNRRASRTGSGRTFISPSCVTSYISPAGGPADMEFHESQGAPKPMIVPLLHLGLDLTEMQRHLLKHCIPGDRIAQHKGAQDAGIRSITPRNRLRK